MRKKKIAVVILMVAIAAWLLLMRRLSMADGAKTLQDSLPLARKVCAWLYEEPTAEQLKHVHLTLRKMAHVALYLVYGGMSALLWDLLLERFAIWKRMIPAIVCCTAVAFLDEMQKIPIAGRHFSLSESLLNAGSALVMILLYFLVIRLCTRKPDRQAEVTSR
ncbi:MAG: VanZ family protein [Ruminococcus sp.]|nr:VanZ family protein [Ruminococcus sp.]